MTYHNPLSRRALGGSLLAVGALAASRAVAAPLVTAESPMGPFYPTGYTGEDDFDMTMLKGRPARALGDVIEVSGRVLDRLGNPIRGAKLELRQAGLVTVLRRSPISLRHLGFECERADAAQI
jgi:protocatechuate 3,4-dioxygenase, beta subunit